jgi:hypothetical protein
MRRLIALVAGVALAAVLGHAPAPRSTTIATAVPAGASATGGGHTGQGGSEWG